MSTKPCKFYRDKGSCRFGASCKFSHSHGDRESSSRPPASGGGNRPPQSSRRTSPPDRTNTQPAGNVPHNACKLYWTTGSCNRSFDCSFKHVKGSNAPPGASEDSGGDAAEPPDLFTAEGFAAQVGSGQQERLSPAEAHNHLKQFLRDTYQFEGAATVRGFVRIFASVNDVNKSWNSDNAQAFLEAVVKGNGIHRLGEVLRFKPVQSRIGYGGQTLSFQAGYFPLFEFFSSDIVLKTTMHKNINHLYTTIEQSYDDIEETLRSCVGAMISAKSWKDPSPNLPVMLQRDIGGAVVFRALAVVYLQLLTRFKNLLKDRPEIGDFVQQFSHWFDTWAADVNTDPPQFQDSITTLPPSNRRLAVSHLREDIERLLAIVTRESNSMKKKTRQTTQSGLSAAQRQQARIMQLVATYDPPGALRDGGARHDNDFEDINRIRIAPTHDELLSQTGPYLPVLLPGAPHHLPEDSIERHLDIQFRLLREELIGPIRSSIATIHDDITAIQDRQPNQSSKKNETQLEKLIKNGGGTYKTSGYDSVFFQVYTNCKFSPVKAERKDLTVGLTMDAPRTGAARDKNASKRYQYWEQSKRLASGSLVALVAITTSGSMRTYLGVLSSFSRDIAESSKASNEHITVRLTFFDPELELAALRGSHAHDEWQTAFLVDNGIMYEASRPFLEHLQAIEPTEIPFARYIARHGSLDDVQVQPPKYATAPGFRFKLSCLAQNGSAAIHDLNISQPGAVERARQQLLHHSILDTSQVDAVINTMTREVSLIQGPPGTGKSFTARELLRVLIKSGVKPIVLIAYTNHALDHMLSSVLEADITTKLVRLGSRSSDERVAEYTLDKLEKATSKTNLDRSIGRAFAQMKKVEAEMLEVMASIQEPLLTWYGINNYLQIHQPSHAERLSSPPFWVQELAQRLWKEEDEHGEWQAAPGAARRKQKAKQASGIAHTFYDFWRSGIDLQYIAPKPVAAKRKGPAAAQPEIDPSVLQFFAELGFDALPPVPTTNRTVSTLLKDQAVWGMSLRERQRLAEEWEKKIRSIAYSSHLEEYVRLRDNYKEACQDWNDTRDETRRRLLSQVDLIGCTTTGAAKLVSLLGSIGPRVLMVEEAGQVLEAHILTSLVTSVHHLICIGDPEQLRPNLATFALSMDSAQGKELYKFDRSLMERLADGKFPMTQINVQRRMRPDVSHFIRTILYPKLVDHETVSKYPHVQGMQKDVFFLDHKNAENASEESSSKFNMYEVNMIRDLVLYFLRQGEYNGEGDIAVLCAYLGQLQKVRQALKDLKIAVAVDERDEEQLMKQGIDDEVSFEQVIVAKHIKLGTVDIFQGQEAKIVIVSLVRNTGSYETGSASIGFLKSKNRINVALSRAKHGLYILGNASNLRKNETWSTIIDEMEAKSQIGAGLPIICPRHPDQTQTISQPGDLSQLAPNGGCLLPCAMQLPCGHICPSMCHDTRDNHRSTICDMQCARTPCPRRHPCSKRCSQDCGDCRFPMYEIVLPCGHRAREVPCYLLDRLEDVKCKEEVIKQLPQCEHAATMPCHQDPAKYICKEQCRGIMGCCGRTCKSKCNDCKILTTTLKAPNNAGRVQRTEHVRHPCERPLYCHHPCGLDCAQDHRCNPSCQGECRQQCHHQKCALPCSTPCAPCMEPCLWSCPHFSCPVACGSICSRVPCDQPCPNTLQCGHACPSVCGEPCDQQTCPACLPEERKQDIVDMLMQRTLDEIELGSADTSERLVTLACGHIFTVETLDGHCGMSDYYEIDGMGKFLATKQPPTDYQRPPTCPTCRGPITALRYGRVTKRATLDILEQNVASSMSKSLEALNPDMSKLSDSLEKMKADVKKIEHDMEEAADPSATRLNSAAGKTTEALLASHLERGAMHAMHGLSVAEANAWGKLVKDITKVYKKLHVISNTRGAHVRAYEGALSTLYRQDLQAIADDPARATNTPEPVAMETAKRMIGQPPPKADVRFQVEAHFRLLELRYMLAQVACARVEALPFTATHEAGVRHRTAWTAFVAFVYASCVADARKALGMAQSAAASRLAARCAVHVVRAEFEQFRFEVLMERHAITKPGAENAAYKRDKLVDRIRRRREYMQLAVEGMKTTYVRSRPVKTTADLRDERTWHNVNCGAKVDRFLSELEELQTAVKNGSLYQPLTMQEREEIVKAFDFGYTGHFYNCPNGHPYTITECGGAMTTAKCPECGEQIGGGNHTLLASNRTDTEFESILRGTGANQGFY